MPRASSIMQHENIADPTPSTGTRPSPNPMGGRIHKPEHDAARSAASAWKGMPDEYDHWAPLRLLERPPVAERLGLTSDHVSVVRWHVQQTRKADWQTGSRPVVGIPKWRACMDLRISQKRLERIEYKLACHGLIYWHDSASCRRFFKRDKATGRLVHAYGVDLSPLAMLLPTLESTAAQIREFDNEKVRLRHRISAIRRLALNRAHAAMLQGDIDPDCAKTLHDAAAALPCGSRLNKADLRSLRALEPVAERIRRDADTLFGAECRQQHDDNRPDGALPRSHGPEGSSDKSGRVPTTPGREGSITNTNYLPDTNVVAAIPSGSPAPDPEPAARHGPERRTCSRSGPDVSSPSPLPSMWLIVESLSPRIACHLPVDRPTGTADLYEAANRARSAMGISPDAWREACRVLTRDGAALSTIVIASRLDAEEIRSPGGYLRGMIDSARRGDLHLARSLWGVVDRVSATGPEPLAGDGSSPAAPHGTPPPGPETTNLRAPPDERKSHAPPSNLHPVQQPGRHADEIADAETSVTLPSLDQQSALLTLSGSFARDLPPSRPLNRTQIETAVRRMLSSAPETDDGVQPALRSAWQSACRVVGESAATAALLVATAGASHGLCRKAPSRFFAEIVSAVSSHALDLENAASAMLQALEIGRHPPPVPPVAEPLRPAPQ